MDELLAMAARGAWAQCWQVTALIAFVSVVVRFVGRNRPHLASVLWLVVMAKCVTPPVVSCPWGVFCWLQPTNSISVMRPATEATPSGREQYKRWDSDTDTVVNRLSSRPGKEGAFDRDPRSEPLLAAGEKVVRQSFSARAVLIWCVLTGWVVGCVLFVVVTIGRVRSCWRKLKTAGEIQSAAVVKLLESIRCRLKLRRTVRLWVTPTLIGPAVFGIWRPTIILPAALVNGKSPSELEPLLAHELMHIRRGDLWTGLLQTLAVGLWWFHPLVQLASRLLTREAERCCDEQVIAHLHYEPRFYAQSLVDVLALKQQLQPVPVCPGVRPVDVTSQRLERIMRLRHGCNKRTPWPCWIAMLLLSIAALPGAVLARRHAQPAHPEFTLGEIVAKVGEKAILYDDIKPTVDLMLELLSAKSIVLTEEKSLEARRQDLTKEAIERAVQRKLLLVEFRRNIPGVLLSDAKKKAEMESKLNRNIHVAFYRSLKACSEKTATASGEEINKLLVQEPMIARLALLMKVRGLKNTEELDAALRELGTSLERQVDDFGEQIMGMEAVRSSSSKITNRSKRQEAEQQVLSRIRAATAVWTIYDDPL